MKQKKNRKWQRITAKEWDCQAMWAQSQSIACKFGSLLFVQRFLRQDAANGSIIHLNLTEGLSAVVSCRTPHRIDYGGTCDSFYILAS
jgi:hypothetical protein